MKLADLQAKLKSMHITAPTVVPTQAPKTRKRKAEPCPYDDVYYTIDDMTDAEKTAIARFHYSYFMNPPPQIRRPEDVATFELLKRHTLAEWGKYLPAECK